MEKKVAIDRWVDRYTARLDQALSAAWPDLASRLQEGIDHFSWYELAAGPGKEFSERRIEPAVKSWVERHVQPVLDEATQEFRNSVQLEPGQIRGDTTVDGAAEGTLRATDVAKALTLPGGLLLGGGAVATAIGTVTSWLIFTTVVVNWPLLIGGLVLAAALSLFGVYSLAHLKADLQDRFKNRMLPRIEDAVMGKGIQQDGKHVPSLKDQLVRQVEEMAKAARKHLNEKGGAP